MAPQATPETTELDDLAFQIYSARVAANPVRRGGEQEAIDSYRQAEAFLSTRKRVKAGELKPVVVEGPQLTDCCAPNLPHRTHPHNMVSQRFGDLARVNRIKRWLDVNPTPENDPAELVHRLNREFTDLNWDLPTINTARAIFGAYAVAAK